jgi:hypothetical protein
MGLIIKLTFRFFLYFKTISEYMRPLKIFLRKRERKTMKTTFFGSAQIRTSVSQIIFLECKNDPKQLGNIVHQSIRPTILL